MPKSKHIKLDPLGATVAMERTSGDISAISAPNTFQPGNPGQSPVPGEKTRHSPKRSREIKPNGTGRKSITAPMTKTELVLVKLRGAKGISIEALAQQTGWQLHSVRGFLSGTVRKKLCHTLISEVGKDGTRRYRITGDAERG